MIQNAPGKYKSAFCCRCHIRVHIRAQQEGIVQFTARCSARSPHIRPQRKFECSRSFQISFILVPSFQTVSFPLIYKPETLFSFSYKACGFVVCIIFSFTQFVNRLILIFPKLSFLHDSVPAFLHPACAGWSRVGR